MSEKHQVGRIRNSQFLRKTKVPHNIYPQGAHSFLKEINICIAMSKAILLRNINEMLPEAISNKEHLSLRF